MAALFRDGPEYEARKRIPFKAPTKIHISEIHAAVPHHLHDRSTSKAIAYVARDIVMAMMVYVLGSKIDSYSLQLALKYGAMIGGSIKWMLWALYWYIQGLVLAGWFVLGHEAGHGALFPKVWMNNTAGYCLHTLILVPYFNWRASHHADGTFVPRTRSHYNLPPKTSAHITDYHDIFEETPIYSLVRIIFMQLLGWQTYLLTNALGNPGLPAGTNHFSPSSPLFRPHDREGIIASNIGLSVMVMILWSYIQRVGFASFFKLYFIPYLLANHWVVMLTFLHHSDPTIPHYRNQGWTFIRGALATVDRPLLGWGGRFFLHNISHDHIAHHFFTRIPFYNLPQVTEYIKPVLKEHYNFDSTNCFRALYRSFTECCFIEDDGDIVFYKNKDGIAVREIEGDLIK